MKVEFDTADLEPLIREIAAAVAEELYQRLDPLKVSGKWLLDRKQTSALLGICDRTLRTMVKEERIPHCRLNKKPLQFPVDALREYLRENTVG